MTGVLGKPDVIAPTFDDVDMSDLRLPMLILYERPKDYPDKIVCRVWEGTAGPTTCILLFDTVAEAHAAIPPGFIKLARLPADDPKILAVYI